MHAIWDPGWLVAVYALGGASVLLLLIIAAGIAAAMLGDDLSAGLPVAGLAGLGLVLCLAVLGFVSFPWSGQYHRFVPKTGVVTAVGSRFLASGTQGGGSTQKFVVTMGGRDYGCNDTRCATVRKGDRLTLMCERSWQWAGVPGWDCNWGIDHQANGNVIP